MADVLLDAQGTPITPTAGQALVYVDSISKQQCLKNDTGRVFTLGSAIRNWNVADVVANAADTYLTGSALAIPQHLLQAGTLFRWELTATKTAAGVAAPTWSIRVGTTGTLADAARITFAGPVQTAVIDTGKMFITALLRNTGAAGILAGDFMLNHNLATTGFSTVGSPTLQGNSAGFDTTTAGLIAGLSVNPGAAGVWTHQLVLSEALNI
jgi:hypothetical protein